MKRGLALILRVAFTMVFLQGCEKKESPNTADQEAIKKSIDLLVEAYNHHDAEKVSSFWAQDGHYIDLTTQKSYEGNSALIDYFNHQFMENGAEKLEASISTMYFTAPDKAIVKGMNVVDYKDRHRDKTVFSAQYIKEDGKWVIQELSDVEYKNLSHFEELKELDWLAGEWIDEDENIDVQYSFAWDKNKNFLTQHFTLHILGQEQLIGMQIIGWDPHAKKIHSWIFDSDGGIGESVWSKEDNTWYSILDFIMPQGERASATHVYHKIDENTFTFASENREVHGKLLPNIGPFKVIRKK